MLPKPSLAQCYTESPICFTHTYHISLSQTRLKLWWVEQSLPMEHHDNWHSTGLASNQFVLTAFESSKTTQSLLATQGVICWHELKIPLFMNCTSKVVEIFSQMKHQLDATLRRFYFCRVTQHVSGASARNMLSDPAEIKPAQCCIKLVFHLTYTMMHGNTKLKWL